MQKRAIWRPTWARLDRGGLGDHPFPWDRCGVPKGLVGCPQGAGGVDPWDGSAAPCIPHPGPKSRSLPCAGQTDAAGTVSTAHRMKIYARMDFILCAHKNNWLFVHDCGWISAA